ncbi:MAG: helix-turn-helix domain-containing protein [Oscillospiraceae bacterium]|nr:helix-turn-helix domain-containing protein [Oscillospiraceae bacterium]
MNIGIQIKTLRGEKHVTQEALAEAMGVSAQAVSKWETEASLPDITLLPQLAAYFGVAIDELFDFPVEAEFERIENMFWHERRIPQDAFERAVRFLEKQLAGGGDAVRANECLAYLYNHRAASDHELASEYAKRVIEAEPDRKGGWVAYQEANGAVCGDEWWDNHFTVIEYCKEVLAKKPDCRRALYTIIENLLSDKRYLDAVPYIERMGEIAKDSHQYLLYSGDAALGRGEIAEARRLWDKSVAEFPDRWQAWCDRADRLKKLGLAAEAEADYEKSMELQASPRLTDPLFSLAQMHELAGEYEKAIRDNERIVEVLAKDFDTTNGEEVDARRREIERLRALMKKAR